jgi:hypothetical protein
MFHAREFDGEIETLDEDEEFWSPAEELLAELLVGSVAGRFQDDD